MDLQLHRITRLVRDYHAVLPWKAIHIAGTNGKGTTAAYLSAFLHGKGIKVGRFNSPHLKYRHDCIVLNEQTVDKDLFTEVEKVVKRRDADGKFASTSFELLTATAFELFARQKIDVAVVECGLGGRLDATNILLPEEVLCSAITRISLDHQDMLGDTIEKIATEKAGIVKPGVPLVVDRHNRASVLAVLKASATAATSAYYESDENSALLSSINLPEGVSSQHNLATATKVFEAIASFKHLDLSPLKKQDLQHAIAQVSKTWQGRLQWEDLGVLSGSSGPPRMCLIDGAHNREGAARLREYVDQQLQQKSTSTKIVTWVIGMSAGKKIEEILGELVRSGDQVLVCEFGEVDGMPWVKPHNIVDLQTAAQQLTSSSVMATKEPLEAVRAALKATQPDGLVVIAGSLYLVGHVLREVDLASANTSS